MRRLIALSLVGAVIPNRPNEKLKRASYRKRSGDGDHRPYRCFRLGRARPPGGPNGVRFRIKMKMRARLVLRWGGFDDPA